MHGIPYGEETYYENGEEHQHDVPRMNADRISINDERTASAAQFYESEGLLREAQQESQHNAHYSTYGGNESSFEKEDARYLLVCGTKVAQRHHVVFLVDDKHRE